VPRYRYIAHTLAGQRIMGEENAPDEPALIRILQSRELFVTRVAMAGNELGQTGPSIKKSHEKVLDEDRLYFVREMGTLLLSGIPFDHALDLVNEQVRSTILAKALTQVREDVNAGLPFHQALARHPKSIPPLWSNLVEAGETGGDIAGVLQRIAGQLEQTMALRKKIVSAMIYPAVLIGMTVVAISIFLLFVIPAFSKVFKSMNAKLPAITSMILGASGQAKIYFVPIVLFVVLCVYIFRKYVETPVGRRALDLWLVRTPLVGPLVRDIVLARMAITLAAVLASGVGMIYALDIVSRSAGNKIYEEALANVMEDVRDGSSLSKALGKRAIFSPLMIQMVIVGEESGKLPEMIQKVATYYEGRVETLVTRIGVQVKAGLIFHNLQRVL